MNIHEYSKLAAVIWRLSHNVWTGNIVFFLLYLNSWVVRIDNHHLFHP